MRRLFVDLGEQFSCFCQFILELVTNFVYHAGNHVVRVPVPAVLLAVHTQVGSQQQIPQLQLAIPPV